MTAHSDLSSFLPIDCGAGYGEAPAALPLPAAGETGFFGRFPEDWTGGTSSFFQPPTRRITS